MDKTAAAVNVTIMARVQARQFFSTMPLGLLDSVKVGPSSNLVNLRRLGSHWDFPPMGIIKQLYWLRAGATDSGCHILRSTFANNPPCA